MAEQNKNVHGWKNNMDFGLEDEVNRAVFSSLVGEQYSNIYELGNMKAIKGTDGKDEYSFDGVFEATKDDTKYLFVGEVKQCLEAHDVRDAEARRVKLCKRLQDVKLGCCPSGARPYNSQTRQFLEYADFQVVLYVAGGCILPAAFTEAKAVGCAVVQPHGGRFRMDFPGSW